MSELAPHCLACGIRHWPGTNTLCPRTIASAAQAEIDPHKDCRERLRGFGVMQDDMTALMLVLGIPTCARDASPHEVMVNEIIPKAKACRDLYAASATAREQIENELRDLRSRFGLWSDADVAAHEEWIIRAPRHVETLTRQLETAKAALRKIASGDLGYHHDCTKAGEEYPCSPVARDAIEAINLAEIDSPNGVRA